MRFRRLALQMHNRQSGPSRTGVATNAQLLIIVLLNTQFSQPGTDCSAGAIIMEENKARQRHVSEKKGNKYSKRQDMHTLLSTEQVGNGSKNNWNKQVVCIEEVFSRARNNSDGYYSNRSKFYH